MISNQDQKFLEISHDRKKLTANAMKFCEERMNMGIPPAITAIREGFLSQEEVEKIYRLFESDQPCALEIAVIDNSEHKLIEEIRKRGLLTQAAWNFCYREQKRLGKTGYSLPLSSVILGTGCLDSTLFKSICQEMMTEVRINSVEREISQIEISLPQIRNFTQYQKRKEAKAKAQLPLEVQIMEKLDKVVAQDSRHSSEKGCKNIDTKADSETSEVNFQQMVQVNGQNVPNTCSEKQTEADGQNIPNACSEEQTSSHSSESEITGTRTRLERSERQSTGMISMFTPETLETLVGKITASLEKSLAKFLIEERPSQEPDDFGKKIYKEGKRYVSKDEALALLQGGGSLEKAYIGDLRASSISIPNAVSFTNCCIENLDLSEVQFQDSIDFEGTVFLGKAIFHSSTFQKQAMFRKTLFVDGADFAKVTFAGDAHFNSAAFRRFVSFNHSQFGSKSVFSHAHFDKGVKFAEVTFANGASVNDISCDHRFNMEKCHFEQETTFSNSQFGDIADFFGSKFDKVAKFKGTQFAKWTSFNYATFKEECHFCGVTISGDLSFKWSKFEGLIDLKTLCAERNVDFNNAEIKSTAAFSILDAYFGRLFLTRSQIENHLDSHIQKDFLTAQKEYGLLKNNFREINEYDREDWAYQMEKRMERKAIRIKGIGSGLKRFFNWLALDVACGYGTKPLNIFLVSLMILSLFAVGYYFLGSHFDSGPTKVSFWEAIQISFRTFANSEVGGREVKMGSWVNYIMMFQSFFGFFVMTVLVVTFSRKVIR